MHFFKMHGLGNDYIYFDRRQMPSSLPIPQMARRMCMEHFGIGGDGIVEILPPTQNGYCAMRIYNADGSEAEICGNALRCLGLYLEKQREVRTGDSLYIETATRLVRIDIYEADESKGLIGVDMGQAIITPTPIILTRRESTWQVTAIDLGNPHAVCIVDSPWADIPEEVAHEIRSQSQFPLGANIGGMYITSHKAIALRVWERGSGETFACGSGACAAVAAGVFLGKLAPNSSISVSLYGGDLWVNCDENFGLYQKGEAKFVYEGETNLAYFI